MKLIEKLVADVNVDKYFIRLYEKSMRMSFEQTLQLNENTDLTEKELVDILRFSDILSNSTNPDDRNTAYQIITFLNYKYSSNPVYKTIALSVYSKLGNFPAVNYLEKKNSNNALLPFLTELEVEGKKIIQRVPGTENDIFTDSQYKLFSKLGNNIEFSFSGPTSMGKSFLIKAFIRKIIKNVPKENIVILVPTRALINQFTIDLKKDLSNELEVYKYRVLSNSNVTDIVSEEKHSYIFVLTPERLISYLSQNNNPPIGFVFVDEAHKLASNNDSRSLTSYTSIEKTLKKYGNIKLYFSSPNVSNPEVFLRLFDRKINDNYFTTDESPVTQNLFFIDIINRSITAYNKYQNIEINSDFLSEINSFEDLIQHLGKEKNNLIYCNSKSNTIEKANDFSLYNQKSNFKPSKEVLTAIRNIKEYIHPEYYLAQLLEKGVAYHYGRLPQLVRNLVENLYKSEEIKNVFCTSTLLEGVNMPTQNIFILDNKNGRKPLEPIDFWNLSGRAGRLTKELSGNIFCVRYDDNNWKDIAILNKKAIELKPTVISRIDHNLQKIEKVLNDRDISGTDEEVSILKYLANIIKVDSLELDANYKSPVINKLIDKNKDKIIKLANSKVSDLEIPEHILSFNQTINFDTQNAVYLRLLKLHNEKKNIKLPSTQIKYEICLRILEGFYTLYNWESSEKKLKNKNSLKYYAVIMNQWINGFPLNHIISEALTYHANNNVEIQVDYKSLEFFNKTNKQHINLVIEKTIDSLEYILRFLLQKYFNHYYQILVKILGEDNAGENWAMLLEYGTQNRIVIAMQNLGLSRNTALKIYRKHNDALAIKDGKLEKINKEYLLSVFSVDSLEHDEIFKTL
ncbi:DEAD/DEAH box helicase [Flavobacterium sp. LaA7.5]|nr:DEAD/DEAH box helicase [Flavobacterium salilacus subsp. altitudinum]